MALHGSPSRRRRLIDGWRHRLDVAAAPATGSPGQPAARCPWCQGDAEVHVVDLGLHLTSLGCLDCQQTWWVTVGATTPAVPRLTPRLQTA